MVLHRDGQESRVSVRVGSGHTWLAATRFPHTYEDTGASTGDASLDQWIRQRAAEELIRLAAAREVWLGGRGDTEDIR